MITGDRLVAGPIPTKNLDPLSLKCPPGQCGLVLILHPPPHRTADLLVLQEGEVRTAARLTENTLVEVPAVPPQAHYEQCTVYLFQLATGSCRDLQYVLRSTPTLVLPYRYRARRFAKSALRRLPPRPTLVEHRSWHRGMPSMSLVQCQAPLDFLERVPPLPPGELRVYDYETNRHIQTMTVPRQLAVSPPPVPPLEEDDPVARTLWSAFKRILEENLGSREKALTALVEERGSADRLSCASVLRMMDASIAHGPLFKRRGLRSAARELINDLYSRHSGVLQQAGLTEEFDRYFAKWKGS